MWKRNLTLILALHIGAVLFPFLTVSREELTPDRVTPALAVLAVILSFEILSLYLIFKRHGLKLREGVIWTLELEESDYARLGEEERNLANKFGYVIIGFPTAAIILCGAILEWGDVALAFKFLLVFFAFIIPLLQICILPLIILFYTYNRFISKNTITCLKFSKYWVQLSVAGLALVILSLLLTSKSEKEILPFLGTITDHQTVFFLTSLFNIFVGVLQYVIAKTRSRTILAIISSVLYSSPVLSFALLLELFRAYSFQETLKVALISVLIIFLAMFTATWFTLRVFGYSLDTLEKAVEDAKAELRKPLKNVFFWLIWINAAIAGLGIALKLILS